MNRPTPASARAGETAAAIDSPATGSPMTAATDRTGIDRAVTDRAVTDRTVAGRSPRTERSTAAQRARQRRQRRLHRATTSSGPGRPIRAALANVPYVLVLMALLAGGVSAVLWLNTLADEAGIEQSRSVAQQRELRLQIEALRGQVADLNSTVRIAQAAKDLGLVPVGDTAVIEIDPDGTVRVIGEPTPARSPGAADPAATGGATSGPQSTVDDPPAETTADPAEGGR